MKIKKGYSKSKAYEGWAVVPVGEESKKKKIMLTLNDTAAEIWDMLCEGKSKDEMITALKKEYNIPTEQAENGVTNIIETLLKEGILEE